MTTTQRTDTDLLTEMADMARQATDLVAALPAPVPFDGWDGFRAAFDRLDTTVAQLLRSRLETLRPGTPWLDELAGDVPESGEYWLVDGVDGAVQYLRGLPYWSVSISLLRDGRAALAALRHGRLCQTYTAGLGVGAFLDGKAIAPSAKSVLGVSIVTMNHPPVVAHDPAAITGLATAMTRLLPVVGAVRNFGPTSWQVADVAAGRTDAFVEYGVDAANLTGAALVASAAGAVVTDVDGRPWGPASASFLAAPSTLHGQLVQLLAGA
jgi:myo-inositol-1(or 4)-monophosphatase